MTSLAGFTTGEAYALQLDASDPVPSQRSRFHVPSGKGGEVAYLCGNSLGLQPRAARAMIQQELDDWQNLAVEGHHHAARPWYPYHEQFAPGLERILGAQPGAGEVVAMNSLTVNLHLMLATFYQPTPDRPLIALDGPVFPSDLYAAQTHARVRGIDPADAIYIIQPRDPLHGPLDIETIEAELDRIGERISVLLFSGVNFLSGQAHDISRITALGHTYGCIVGFDLAHAAGNLELKLHEWNVDFASWCSYKYLNGGPGAVAGCFIHERHARNVDLPRLAGWWGNDPESRFRMHLDADFVARPTAEGWQLSNPPVLAMTPLLASLDVFEKAGGMHALRQRSLRLTSYLRALLEALIPEEVCTIITPRDEDAFGCQLSLVFSNSDDARARHAALQAHDIVCDFRPPDVIRLAPTPLYNTFHDCWRGAQAMAETS
ncbi:MAG: kynureninase [Phycisphaerales bacterium]